MPEKKPKKKLPAVFRTREFKKIMNLERELQNDKPISSKDIQYYTRIQYDSLIKALNIHHRIKKAKDPIEEADTQYDKIFLYENATNPLFHGLVKYTNHDCFNEAPDRNKLREYFNLDANENTEILDRAIIHFLTAAFFFQGIRYKYYGDPLYFDQEELDQIEPENIDATITKSKQTLDKCLDKKITYKEIENSLKFLAYRGELDYVAKVTTETLPS